MGIRAGGSSDARPLRLPGRRRRLAVKRHATTGIYNVRRLESRSPMVCLDPPACCAVVQRWHRLCYECFACAADSGKLRLALVPPAGVQGMYKMLFGVPPVRASSDGWLGRELRRVAALELTEQPGAGVAYGIAPCGAGSSCMRSENRTPSSRCVEPTRQVRAADAARFPEKDEVKCGHWRIAGQPILRTGMPRMLRNSCRVVYFAQWQAPPTQPVGLHGWARSALPAHGPSKLLGGMFAQLMVG